MDQQATMIEFAPLQVCRRHTGARKAYKPRNDTTLRVQDKDDGEFILAGVTMRDTLLDCVSTEKDVRARAMIELATNPFLGWLIEWIGWPTFSYNCLRVYGFRPPRPQPGLFSRGLSGGTLES